MFQSVMQLAETSLQLQYQFLRALAILYGALAVAASLLCLGGLAAHLLSGKGFRRRKRGAVAVPVSPEALCHPEFGTAGSR